MEKTLVDAVFTSLPPFAYYRPSDLEKEHPDLSGSTIRAALRQLARCGLVERIRDGQRSIYITKQSSLF
jgi:Fe2+ or Zn2+ uptake regulation protein